MSISMTMKIEKNSAFNVEKCPKDCSGIMKELAHLPKYSPVLWECFHSWVWPPEPLEKTCCRFSV